MKNKVLLLLFLGVQLILVGQEATLSTYTNFFLEENSFLNDGSKVNLDYDQLLELNNTEKNRLVRELIKYTKDTSSYFFGGVEQKTDLIL